MNSENSILGNQLVVMSRADLDALVEKMASNLAACKSEECINNDINPVVHENERFITREEASKLLHVDYSTLWRWNKLGILRRTTFDNFVFSIQIIFFRIQNYNAIRKLHAF